MNASDSFAAAPGGAHRPRAVGWKPDPFGRYNYRFFDGLEWTGYVLQAVGNGLHQEFEDPI